MNVKALMLLVCLLILLGASGCGPAGDGIEIVTLSPKHTNLLESVDSKNEPSLKAILQMGTVLYNENALAQNTVRVTEVDNLCKDLQKKLAETNLFSSVEYTGKFDFVPQIQKNEILLVLNCKEKYSYDRMANATSAGLTGFFTLGLAPANIKHGYSSEMTINSYKNGRQTKKYEAFSEVEVTVAAYQGQFRSRGNLAIKKARRQISIDNSSQLIHKMVQDREFFDAR